MCPYHSLRRTFHDVRRCRGASTLPKVDGLSTAKVHSEKSTQHLRLLPSKLTCGARSTRSRHLGKKVQSLLPGLQASHPSQRILFAPHAGFLLRCCRKYDKRRMALLANRLARQCQLHCLHVAPLVTRSIAGPLANIQDARRPAVMDNSVYTVTSASGHARPAVSVDSRSVWSITSRS